MDELVEAEALQTAEGIEGRLAQLAGAVGPLRRVQAALAERLIAREAQARLGYARLADYSRERLGRSGRQLQELARVHRALAGRPRLERALVGNALPWSKVRLVARVATPEDEAAWIARARVVSARRLEHEVREHARAASASPSATTLQATEEAGPETRLAVRCTPAVCERWAVVHEMAERVAGERLRAADALELATAEALSGLALDPSAARILEEEPPERAPERVAEDALERAEAPPASSEDARSPALPSEVAELAAGLEEADAFELDRRLRRAVHLEQTLEARMAPLLRVVACPEYEWRGPWRPLSAYARDELGLSASKARALMRLERLGEACPELRAAYREGRLSWVKAQALLPLLLLDVEATGGARWRPAWVAWAERVTVRRLEADVERALLLRASSTFAFHRCLQDPERAQDPVPEGERQTCAPDVDPEATQELVFRVPFEVASLFRAARETLRTRIRAERERARRERADALAPAASRATPPTDGEVFEALMDRALAAWLERDPGRQRPDPVIERDGYRCAVPGCTSRRNLQDHHVVFRSAGGSDAPANRITLCAFHHQRGLHAGWLGIRGRAPDHLVFELGRRPGGPPLAPYRAGDVALPPASEPAGEEGALAEVRLVA